MFWCTEPECNEELEPHESEDALLRHMQAVHGHSWAGDLADTMQRDVWTVIDALDVACYRRETGMDERRHAMLIADPRPVLPAEVHRRWVVEAAYHDAMAAAYRAELAKRAVPAKTAAPEKTAAPAETAKTGKTAKTAAPAELAELAMRAKTAATDKVAALVRQTAALWRRPRPVAGVHAILLDLRPSESECLEWLGSLPERAHRHAPQVACAMYDEDMISEDGVLTWHAALDAVDPDGARPTRAFVEWLRTADVEE